jgi:hypothetical protein
MVGDPPHDGTWASRERVVYEFEMDKKQIDPRGWSNQLYYEALANNEIIDYLVVRRWKDYAPAHDDNWLWDYDAAERDNSTWEYENNLVGA